MVGAGLVGWEVVGAGVRVRVAWMCLENKVHKPRKGKKIKLIGKLDITVLLESSEKTHLPLGPFPKLKVDSYSELGVRG